MEHVGNGQKSAPDPVGSEADPVAKGAKNSHASAGVYLGDRIVAFGTGSPVNFS